MITEYCILTAEIKADLVRNVNAKIAEKCVVPGRYWQPIGGVAVVDSPVHGSGCRFREYAQAVVLVAPDSAIM